jgi:hypothetical protein
MQKSIVAQAHHLNPPRVSRRFQLVLWRFLRLLPPSDGPSANGLPSNYQEPNPRQQMIKTSIASVFALLVVFVTILARDIPAAVGLKFLFHWLLVWVARCIKWLQSVLSYAYNAGAKGQWGGVGHEPINCWTKAGRVLLQRRQ